MTMDPQPAISKMSDDLEANGKRAAGHQELLLLLRLITSMLSDYKILSWNERSEERAAADCCFE